VFYNISIKDKIEENCLIISLDTGESIETKYYMNKEIYDKKLGRVKNISFGNQLLISDSCFSNQYSHFRRSHFKVLDYEVFSVYLKLFN
jgi:hypothetical protein